MKKLFFVLFGLLLSFQFYAQTLSTFKSKAGKIFISCDVENLITMFKMSDSVWENKIVELGGQERELANDGISYTFIPHSMVSR
ncbi:MAG: hypothetical protein WKF88_01530 [Ferruginibacter sp.]